MSSVPIPLTVLNNFITRDIVAFNKIDIKQTKIGSVKYLLYGPKKSDQSISVKMGKIIGEKFPIQLIQSNSNLELKDCGVLELASCDKKKDFDLVWYNKSTNTLYYRECKGNMDLDTEKLPATIEKVKKLNEDLKIKYKEDNYNINSGILNWSIYKRCNDAVGINQIKRCNDEGVDVDHFKDFLELIGYTWSEDEFYKYFRHIGDIIG